MTSSPISNLLAAVPSPMLQLDQNRQIAAANRAAMELFGDWIIGRDMAMLRQPALLALLEASFASGSGGEAKFVDAGQAGQTVFRVHVTIHEDLGGQGALLYFSDVTHLREAEEMRRDFVANVSHELRTPLTAILGFIETLRGPAKEDPVAQDRFLGIMDDEARRMNRIVSDLLSLSRVEGQERIKPDTLVALDEILAATVAALRPMAEEVGNQVVVHGTETPVKVRGDSDQLMQVFMNLIENALKYGGSEQPVMVRVTETVGTGSLKGPIVLVEVQDFGDGIDDVHLPRLTERFYRIDTHRSREMGGTGLGLAIVKHIVNRHRGRLKIKSQFGEGSIFQVVLPKG